MMSIFWINVFYLSAAAVSVATAALVMWPKVPTGISGTVGLTMISLVMAGICADWLDSNLPWIGVKRSLILWAGLLFVIYWLLQKPWKTWERRKYRPEHNRFEDTYTAHASRDEMTWPHRTPSDEPFPHVDEERRD